MRKYLAAMLVTTLAADQPAADTHTNRYGQQAFTCRAGVSPRRRQAPPNRKNIKLMRTTGLGLSALLLATGAILKWAVTYEAEGIDLNQVGVILFIVGLGLGVVSLIATAAGRRTTIDTQHEQVIDGQPIVERQHETITQHDALQ